MLPVFKISKIIAKEINVSSATPFQVGHIVKASYDNENIMKERNR